MAQLLREKLQITAWLDKYEVKNYTLVDDDIYGFVVDVAGNVDLRRKDLTSIDVQFGCVTAHFSCSHNMLTSLKGCPRTVGSNFYCGHNQLVSLEYCPQNVEGCFYCDNNMLSNLKGCPPVRGDMLNCSHNLLTNFIFFPEFLNYCNLHKNPALGAYQKFTHYEQIKDISHIEAEHALIDGHVAEQLHTNYNTRKNYKI